MNGNLLYDNGLEERMAKYKDILEQRILIRNKYKPFKAQI